VTLPPTDQPVQKTAAPTQARTFGYDPLTASLTYLAAYHGRAVSPEALLGGLPILDGRLSVALYDRAARRAGLAISSDDRIEDSGTLRGNVAGFAPGTRRGFSRLEWQSRERQKPHRQWQRG